MREGEKILIGHEYSMGGDDDWYEAMVIEVGEREVVYEFRPYRTRVRDDISKFVQHYKHHHKCRACREGENEQA